MQRTISFTLNEKPVNITSDDDRPLIWALRSDLGLTGTKFGCGGGLCGACTVIVGQQAVRSCAISLREIAEKRVLTIEGLERNGRLHPLQEAFVKHSAMQCGYCTSGMILNAYAMLLRNPDPSRADVMREMDGNLCRCGAHPRVLDAIADAARAMKGGAQ